MINTARILVDWKCNLKCPYCCNEQERFRKDIHPTALDNIDFSKYQFVCISGGEPLLFMDRVKLVAAKSQGFNILYSNGILWGANTPQQLWDMGIKAANIGLHYPNTFDKLIEKISHFSKGCPLSVRFHVWEKFKDELTAKFPNVAFRFWTMDDCDRDNEDRFVLTF